MSFFGSSSSGKSIFASILDNIFKNKGHFENILTLFKDGIWDSIRESLQNICRERINDSIKRDKQSARSIATYLGLVANDRAHWHKLGAQVEGFS